MQRMRIVSSSSHSYISLPERALDLGNGPCSGVHGGSGVDQITCEIQSHAHAACRHEGAGYAPPCPPYAP